MNSAHAPPFASAANLLTIAASSEDRVFGTLTLGLDNPSDGLQADFLYQSQIDELRAEGCALCEVTRLALDPALSSLEVMATIFNAAFILARVHQRSDLLAEVHPRHAGFYRRTMGYRIAGPALTCRRVNAPAVLMHLNLDFAESQIREMAGSESSCNRSLYRLFLPYCEQENLLKQASLS